MLRSLIKDADLAIEMLRDRNLNWLRWMYQGLDVMKVLASCSRGMLIAAEGKELMSYDFAQIESRIQAWLAGAEWKLKFFREGKIKIYNATGALMFGIKPEEVVDKGEDQLYTAAKIGELACGYQGWAEAIEKFARQMGVHLNLDPADIAGRWREANSEQVQLWYDLNQTAMYAVQHPGEAYAIPNRKIMFKVEGRWLYMRLPSGRRIAYLDPEIQMGDRGDEVSYMGIDTYTRKWMRVSGYGGKWLQNACEGIGRDLLVPGMFNMEEAGYPCILTVHDEAVFEVPTGFGSDEEATRLMTVPLKWADGLPVKCEGWRAKRYRK
jgi:DNA polymerase